MNPKVKKLWTDALRSGEYKQTKGCLKDENGMCCLGVLTDIYIKSGDNKTNFRWEPLTYMPGSNLPLSIDRHIVRNGKESSWTDLTDTIKEWAGLDHRNPKLGINVASCENDGYTDNARPKNNIAAKSFPEIADLIEENL